MHRAHIIHHVRGRMRLKVPGGKGDAELLQRVKEAVSPLLGVCQVDVNPATGSLVIHYDPALHGDFERQLSDHGDASGQFDLVPPELSEVDQLADRIEREAEFLSEQSETAKTLVDMVRGVNVAIRRGTNNTLDLKVLLPLAVALYSVFELESDISTPLWVTLGMFSFNSFVNLHNRAVHVAPGMVHGTPAPAGPPAAEEHTRSAAAGRTPHAV